MAENSRFVLLQVMLFTMVLSGCNPTEMLPPDYRLANGGSYSGEIQDGRFQGEGRYTSPQGDVYVGAFVDGLFEGPGEYQNARGGVFEATFAKGAPVIGRHLTEYGEYSGEFRKWLYHGAGVWTSKNGDRYAGEFVEGELAGPGEYTGADGERYRGEFQFWQFHGSGTLIEPDGNRIEGQFEYGQPVGEGSYHRAGAAGELVETKGRWLDGVFVEAGARTPAELQAAVVERVLAEDSQRLAAQVESLQPERPGVIDTYFLGVGGDGTESVFGRDIRVAQAGLEERFGVAGRSLLLLNDRHYADLPLATRASIRTALEALDARMNPEEDLLAVHLVSHGGADGQFLLRQPGIELANLRPDDLARILDGLKVQRKLIVVSACFSGLWLERLKGDDSLVMASARSDRTSFGCGDDSEMTWFTKALHQGDDWQPGAPEAGFRQVEETIRQWETEQGMTEEDWSYPQFSIGESMRAWLKSSYPVSPSKP